MEDDYYDYDIEVTKPSITKSLIQVFVIGILLTVVVIIIIYYYYVYYYLPNNPPDKIYDGSLGGGPQLNCDLKTGVCM